MGYRTLYIRDSEKLKLYLDNVVVETDKGELQFLISDLKFLIIDNYKTTLSTRLINELTKSNVSVVVCDMTHMPQNQIIPLNGYYASSGMMHKQISWDDNMKKLIHRLIVMAKVQSQIEILKRNGKSIQVIEKLISYKNEVMPGDVTNREGLSAKMYFRELFGPNFNRFDDDIINAGLNYGYAVFRSLITSTVVSKGLLPNFGLFHHNQSNFFNLSDDLIEVFREKGLDKILYKYMNTNKIYAGVSAGAMLFTAASMGDKYMYSDNFHNYNYKMVNGLGILNLGICPHYQNEDLILYNDEIKNYDFDAFGLEEDSCIVIKDNYFYCLKEEPFVSAYYFKANDFIMNDLKEGVKYEKIGGFRSKGNI